MSDYSAGTAYLQIVPTLLGDRASIQRQLDQAMAGGFSVPVVPEVDQRKLADVEAALEHIPDPRVEVELEDDAASAKLTELRTKLEELRDKRIGVDIDAAEASAKLAEIQSELDRVGAEHPDVQVRADVAEASAELGRVQAECDRIATEHPTVRVNADTAEADAQLATTNAEIDRVDGRRASFNVSDNGSSDSSKSKVSALTLAIVGLGPAAIPVAAAAAGALASIGTGAIAAIAGIGTLKLAFSGVGTAVQDMGKAQASAADDAAAAAKKQQTAADQIASAEDGVSKAVEAVATAREQAAASIASAVRSEQTAEQTLTQALRSEQQAQQALTDARAAARRQIEDLTLQVQDGALAQRQAALDVQKAQQGLAATQANPSATALQRQQAQLTYDQAKQQVTDLGVRQKQLSQDKADADAKGVNGSKQVVSAQDQLINAQDRVRQAQDQVRDSAAAVAKAQVDGARQVSDAERGVAEAQRSLAAAQRNSAVEASSSMKTLAKDMANLSPAGQVFANFLGNTLKPKLDELKAAAQSGLFPGLQAGIQAALPQFGLLRDIVSNVAKAMGGLARDAGKALTDPFWTGFFNFIKSTAGPSIDSMGRIFGNVLKGVAGLIQATSPIWKEILDHVGSLAKKFGDFGASAAGGGNKSFNGFMDYIRDNLPAIKQLVKDLVPAITNLVQGIKPFGGLDLSALDLLAKLIGGLPPAVITALAGGIGAVVLAMKGLQGVKALIEGISTATKIWTGIQAAFNLIMSLNPIVLIGLLIIGLVAAVIYAYTHFQWFRDIVNAVWDGIKAATMAVVNWFSGPFVGFWVGLGQWFSNLWTGIKDFFAGIWDWIKRIASDVWNAIKKFFTDELNAYKAFWGGIWDWISTKFSDIWNWIKRVGTDIWNGIKKFFSDELNTYKTLWGGIWDWISKKFSDIWNGIKSTASSIWDGIKQVIKDGVNAVIDGVNWMIGEVNKLLDKLSIPKIPLIVRLEMGGVVPPMMEAGGEVPMYASGTQRVGGGFTTDGPTAIVGEGNPAYPEYVVPTDPKYRSRAMALYQGLGSQLMADGGVLGWLGNTASSAWGAVTNVASSVGDKLGDVTSWLGDFASSLLGDVTGAFSSMISSPFFQQIAVGFAKMLGGGISSLISSSTSAGGATLGPMSASHALDIVNAAKSKGVPHAGAVIAIMTGLAESGLRILANPAVPESLRLFHEGLGFDHDSVGIFQQRQSWGPTPLLMNPFGSAQLFFNKLGRGPYGDYGAEAQRVQVSAYPGAYTKWQGAAEGLVKGAGYDSGGYLPPGLTLAYNGTGRPEPVMTPSQFNAVASGGSNGGSFVGTLTLDNGAFIGQVEGVINQANADQATALAGGRRV